MTRKHALLSASGAYRWLACPPSARLEELFPESSSDYAAEGTAAHALAELKLQHALGLIDEETYLERSSNFEENSDYWSVSMNDYIDDYVSMVVERVNEARNRSKDAQVLLEQRLDFSEWVPDGFGTGDVVIIADDIMEVIDLKYGRGVPVSAEDNAQMRLYALGALALFGDLYDIKTVKMTIIQPRLDSISTDEITAGMLLWWADGELRRRAKLAYDGEGEFKAGDHCRFCRARAGCRARAEANLELAKMEFRQPPLLTEEEIATVLARADELKAWAADVSDYALDQAVNHGVKYPGWKLVEGRSNRKYTDEKAVAETLERAGYTEEDIYQKTVWGITAMERNLGKKRFMELLKDLVIKPAGKPVLVPESDKRPEINSAASAAADFQEG
jgi:hypothetical protein